MIPEDIHKKFDFFSKKISELDFVRIISHYDADGITSAGIIAISLLRMGKSFHVTFLKASSPNDMVEILNENPDDFFIITDLGSGNLSVLEKYSDRIMVMDHHVPEKIEKFVINPHYVDIDGTKYCCSATLAFLFSTYLGENRDLGRFFICGALGDKQDIFSGLNKIALDTAEGIEIKTTLALDHEYLAESLYYLTDPYIDGLSGDRENVKEFLISIGLNPDMRVGDMRIEDKKKLASMLILKQLKNKVPAKYAEKIIRKSFYYNGQNIHLMSEYIDSCGRAERMGLGLLYILGENVLADVKDIYTRYKDTLLKELGEIKKKAKEMKKIVYYYVNSSGTASATSTIAARYIFPGRTVVAIHDDGSFAKISVRKLDGGRNLGEILRAIAPKFGGHGGGHIVAGGANIPSKNVESFLKELDRIL